MAGRIPDQFIDELLARVDITDIISSRLTLRKTGQNYSALCPFHNEKSPSFSVNPAKQFYYCFGCGAGGNAISFVMENDHLDFVEAIELLAKDAGMEVPREQGAPDRYEQNADLLNQLTQSASFFQKQLIENEQKTKATDYLAKERGLSGQIAKVFGLGFAPPGWDNLLQTLGKSGDQKEQLLLAGMLIEKKDQAGHFYDRFRDRIMFPIRDSRGRVIAFGGRAFGDEKPKYLNSPETPVFQKSQELYGLYEAKQNTQQLDHILIVEGYMDVIVLAQHGITNAVATLGTSVNSNHIKKLFKLVSKVTLCFDGDKAGRAAAIRGLEATLPVMQDGKQVRFLFLPEGEDPDSLVRDIGKDAFTEKLEDSSSLSHVLFEHARNQVTLADEEGEAQFAQNVMSQIQALPEITYKSVLLKQLEEQAGIDTSKLSAQKPKYQRTAEPAQQQHYDEAQYTDYDDIPLPEHLAYDHDEPHYDYSSTPAETGYQTKKKNSKKSFGKGKWQDQEELPPPMAIALTQTEHAILCLLLHPNVAADIEVSEPLLRQPDLDMQIFSKVWRFFNKHSDKNLGHLLGNWQNQEQTEKIYYLLNHQDAHTKSKLINAKQEVKDMIASKEESLGLNNAISRLKSKGNETIKDNNSREELRRLIEQMRKKK
ncbi:DNA primase [Marinomonas sp. MED121]|uniref:DNA primase n=1 Tax=Marinomonas sp. MED121 TaxID=314277 RepID=UPI00006903A9|nr:DNA primase [Marinomonas sp. MED121]EAQ66521.1 DNA primase [Marinomonas sp. MED121]